MRNAWNVKGGSKQEELYYHNTVMFYMLKLPVNAYILLSFYHEFVKQLFLNVNWWDYCLSQVN